MAIDGTWRRNCVLNGISATDAQLTLGGGPSRGSTSKSFFLLLSSTGPGLPPMRTRAGQRCRHRYPLHEDQKAEASSSRSSRDDCRGVLNGNLRHGPGACANHANQWGGAVGILLHPGHLSRIGHRARLDNRPLCICVLRRRRIKLASSTLHAKSNPRTNTGGWIVCCNKAPAGEGPSQRR